MHELNVPHAFVPHPDVMSPTGAPWAARPVADIKVEVKVEPQAAMPTVLEPQNAPYKPAHKRIMSAADLRAFLESQSFQDFIGFILAVNEACMGKKLSQLAANPSEPIQHLLALLSTLSTWVTEIPPAEQSLRYGNPAFRTWHARLVQQAEQLLQAALPPHLHPAVTELVPYLTESFGNPIRIDYGTGHETTFVALLFCLARLGFVTASDAGALAGAVFAQYVALMRRIQTTYWLEPAGSHGVWGLDDYQFFPFIWGSAELCNHPVIRPKSILTNEILEAYAHEYLYLAAVQFVKQVKKGPLQETSPMICDIAAVPVWTKVNSGMIKMYKVEVCSKLPIMQHFLFGRLLPFPTSTSSASQSTAPSAGEVQGA